MSLPARRRQPALIPAEQARVISDWSPVNVPQVLPSGYPHNLPPLRDQAKWSPFTGLTPGEIPPSGIVPGPGAGIYDPHHYASLIQGVIAVGLASVQLITEPSGHRNFLSIRNSSPASELIFVSFGTPALTSSWLRLTVNQIVLFDEVVPQNDVYVISDTATGQVSFAFSNIA